VILSLVSAAGAGVPFFDFHFASVTVGNETAAAIKTTAPSKRVFTALFQPRTAAFDKENVGRSLTTADSGLFVISYWSECGQFTLERITINE
jgi:hypothetical protein